VGQIKAFEERILSQCVERQLALTFERYSFQMSTALSAVLTSVVGRPRSV
jgi:hypothetical protein